MQIVDQAGLFAGLFIGAVHAHAASATLDKIKSTGAVTMGVRE